VVSLCNNRQGVLQVIDSLKGTGDASSHLRLARLHGRRGPDRLALRGSADWQACERAVKASMERPDLRLDA
jgi:beta-N-acetylhexosaminidase